MQSDRQLEQELLTRAIEEKVIDGCLRADGWVYLYVKDRSIRLTEGQLTAFLKGAVGWRYQPAPLSEPPASLPG